MRFVVRSYFSAYTLAWQNFTENQSFIFIHTHCTLYPHPTLHPKKKRNGSDLLGLGRLIYLICLQSILLHNGATDILFKLICLGCLFNTEAVI